MAARDQHEQVRLSFIADAIEALTRSTNDQETLASIARIAVPRIADWCTVDIVEHHRIKRLAMAHIDPAKIVFMEQLDRRYPPRTPRILETGEPEWIPQIEPGWLDAWGVDEEYRRALRSLQLRSYVAVPIKRRGSVYGVITLWTAESARTLDEADLATAIRLASRASLVLENSLLTAEIERARERTSAERDRFLQFVSSAPVAIAILRGPELIFEVINEPFERTFGGRHLQSLEQVAVDPTGGHIAEIHQTMTTGMPFRGSERAITYDWEGRGAKTRYFDYAVTPLHNAARVVDGVLLLSIDVTEQVVARQKLDDARRQAELANRAKDEFLAMLGHELRNPLAPILTALELMALRSPEAHVRERTVIERQVRHVVRLVDDLLDVSRITRGTIQLHREDLDIADCITKGIEIASPLLEERHHQLTVMVSRGLLVSADPVRLAQIFANLVTNAAKYTEPNGQISITAAREGDLVAIHVHDSGVGISPEVLPSVFDRFYQGSQALDRAQGGLGLGLAIVRSLVELHGGKVAAISEGPGKGSEFAVWLPAIELDGHPRPEITAPDGPHPVRHEKILVVDDNADALNMLADGLEQRGFATYRAHDAPSALAIAAEFQPTVALLDIGLPVMDGYELARRLRETKGNERVQLVAVTGYGQPSDIQRSRDAGFAAHLVKPISLETVNATIDAITAASHEAAAPT